MYIFLFAIYIFVVIVILVQKEINIKSLLLLIMITFFLIVFATYRDGAKVNDYENYLSLFEEDFSLSDSFLEPSFILLSNTIKLFFNDGFILLLFVYAFLGVTIKMIAIKTLTEFWFVSVLIYLSYFFLVQEMTQIRAGVATGFFLLSIIPLYNRKYVLFLILSLIAFLFHFSAFISFIFIFVSVTTFNRKAYIALIPLSYFIYFSNIDLLYLSRYIPIESIQYKIEIYQSAMDTSFIDKNDINVFSALQILRICIFYFFIYHLDLLVEKNKYNNIFLKVYCFAISSLVLFANVPSIAFRIADFLLIIEILLLPNFIYIFESRKIANLIILSFCFIQLYISLFNLKLIF